MQTTTHKKHDSQPATNPSGKSVDERIETLQTASALYRARVQAESAAERAKPPADYSVGRSALDEAMDILGRARFTAATEQPNEPTE